MIWKTPANYKHTYTNDICAVMRSFIYYQV